MRPGERRAGENEALYREVNERVRDLNETFEIEDERVEFVCECGRLECRERISLTLAEYERLRGDPHRFAVVPGHEMTDVERVVAEHERYAVVEKDEGEPAKLAEREDPRS